MTLKKWRFKISLFLKDDPQSFNVTFESSSSVSRIYDKTRIMRKESRITNYIPRQFKDRLRAVSEFDYNLRLDKKYQTRIKMGIQDLELHKKLRGTRKWERVALPSNLPPVDLNNRPFTPVTHSPPPGRPNHECNREKRGRESSSGSESAQNVAKLARQVGADEDNMKNKADREQTWRETVENAELVSESVISGEIVSKSVSDVGSFISVQGTTSKKNPTLEFVQSPIISKSEKKPQV